MITHRYGPYDEADSREPWNTDRLMQILSELLMKHDMALEDALNELISRGMPVNLFLKEGGMEDLIAGFLKQLEERRDSLLSQYRLNQALSETDRDVEANGRQIEEVLPERDAHRTPFLDALRDRSQDRVLQLKPSMLQKKDIRPRDYASLLRALEDLNRIHTGMQRFHFTGNEDVDRPTALQLLDALEQIEELRGSLEEARRNGDLFQFDLERLAEILGPESYQEFLETRQRIFDRLTELLEKQGRIVRNEQGELQLSPESIRRIGRKALEHIFSHLKQDASGGNLLSPEEGSGDQLSAAVRSFEAGDNISNLDPAGSIINAVIRTGKPRPGLRDLEVFRARGQARSSTAVLIDMSGSMQRSERFYFAKKMVLALDALIRQDYAEDRLILAGFGTTARTYSPAEIPALQPFPVTIFDPHIRLRFDLAKRAMSAKKGSAKPDAGNAAADVYQGIPLYFTNLHRGLSLCRQLLGGGETKNKQILLITDGVPTAHFEGNTLHINYPPSPADFEFALREARACTDDGITINTFLLTSEWGFNFFDERPFIEEFVRHAKGRVFYPHPSRLDQFVLMDFIEGKKRLVS